MNDFIKSKYRRVRRMRSKSSVGRVLRCYSSAGQAMTASDVADKTKLDIGYIRSLLSKMTSSDPTFKCEYGNMPLLRLDEKRLDEESNQMESYYTWNYKYGNEKLN